MFRGEARLLLCLQGMPPGTMEESAVSSVTTGLLLYKLMGEEELTAEDLTISP
jgi:hypothetical protein